MKIQLEIQSVVNGFTITDIDTKRIRVCERDWELDKHVREFVSEAQVDALAREQESAELAKVFGLDQLAARGTV